MNIVEETKEATTLIQIPECELREIISVDVICRLCANQNDKLIGIYSDDGICNDLANKMNMYLPVKVSETDDLPLQCCWNCASTVLAWHDLVVTSVEADRRLRSYQFVIDKQLSQNVVFETEMTQSSEQTEEEITQPVNTSLNAFCQTDTSQTSETPIEEDKKNGKVVIIRRRFNFLDFPTSEQTVTTIDPLGNYITSIEHPYEITTSTDITEQTVPFKLENSEVLLKSDENIDQPVEEKKFDNVLERQELGDSSCDGGEEIPEKDDENDDVDDDDEDDDDDEEKEFSNVTNYACKFCSSVFEVKEDIEKHLKDSHSEHASTEPIKKERRKNPKIDQSVVNAAKIVVDNRIYYKCKECGKSLHSPYTYVWHMRIHTGERPFVCELCGKQFRVSQGLVRHLKETHERIKNFPCDLCGRMFATRRNVEEHRRIHTNERPYICNLCGKAFKQKASLFVHNRSHTDSFPFKCSYCNQGFRTKPPLLIHITRHTGEKPYPCEVCGRCFRIKYELKRHRLIHSDEKPFSCTECGLSFRQKRYLRNHNKLNHNNTS